MAYPNRPDHDVIKHLTVDINAGEKVGVVGRTGAGKSTLVSALFRLTEAKSGRVLIDGLDIKTLGLTPLRRGLQMIPQDPMLWSGSIRSNLDQLDEHTDHDLWNALDRAGLKPFVAQLEGQLEYQVEQQGKNLSLGQRQLLCLARAILAEPKVLIMDEATASVDMEADRRIQDLIRTDFKDTTVISIAHRLDSVLTYDRILVLADGQLVEQGSPAQLLSDQASIFYGMVQAMGAGKSDR